MVDEQLAAASQSVRSNVSKAAGYSPGPLVFCGDLFLDVPIVADLLTIYKQQQLTVHKSLHCANAKRYSYN